MSGYTKGPWDWENGVLCSDKYIVGGNSHSFNASNKALIAAAPDLLEALKLAKHVAENMLPANSASRKRVVQMAGDAIAKAIGES
ncbi:hypothetical protein [Pectobacterium parmentieri]|uniref:hypothetical protein n=1 Tax=Pectobacterium parmentieri TaxID=1905730 RepID=UPI000F8EC3BF|nr:hypothetical protein [Pectobacterium parmentieri]AZS56745.1 hypothetical protein C5E18_11740 [Pectobacterium parmentieri]MBI0431764.1 hypothetical protein [Pectobacterium parmentieri]